MIRTESNIDLQPCERDPSRARRQHAWRSLLLVLTMSLASTSAGLWWARADGFTDDAGFFFRYADHLASGLGFRWNPGEPPIWGASAPCWALLLAGTVSLGITPESAAILLGFLCTIAATVLLAHTALRLAGWAAAVACMVLIAANFKLCFWATQGMESPLTYLLVAAGLAAVAEARSEALPGVIAGFCLVHKLDLAPFGLLVLLSAGLRRGRFPWRAAMICFALAAAWYGFATIYFGSPLPNSFLTKLKVEYGSVPRYWFFNVAFRDGSRKILTLMALLSLPALWHRRSTLMVSWLLVLSMAAAYSLKPPSEPWEWYAMPVQPVLCFLAAIGLVFGIRYIGNPPIAGVARATTLAVVSIALVGILCLAAERKVLVATKQFLHYVEGDRCAAGRWIAEHTPSAAKLLTGYGNVAYYSRRYVYDASYLNRRLPKSGPEDFVARYHPDLIAICNYLSSLAPSEVSPVPGYHIEKIFGQSYRQGGIPFYVVVMRSDSSGSPGP